MSEVIKIGISTINFDEVEHYLGEWKNLRTNKQYQEGLRRASRVFTRGIRIRLRQRLLGRGRTTGNLLESVGYRLKRRKPDAIVGFGTLGRHAHLVDRGTVKRYHKSGKYVGVMPANYFHRDTVSEDGARAAEEFKKGIANALFK